MKTRITNTKQPRKTNLIIILLKASLHRLRATNELHLYVKSFQALAPIWLLALYRNTYRHLNLSDKAIQISICYRYPLLFGCFLDDKSAYVNSKYEYSSDSDGSLYNLSNCSNNSLIRNFYTQ